MRVFEAIEKGLRIYKENSDTEFFDILFGSGAPVGTSGETDEAPIGSQYNDTTNGAIYVKRTSTSTAGDWINVSEQGVQLDELSWRNETVDFATDDSLSAGTFDITTLTDNNDLVIGDLTVNHYIIGDRNGSPALFEITSLPGGDDVTIAAASQPIANNDTFVVQNYLPDPSGQEDQAIIHVPVAGSAAIKIADVNWSSADAINLTGTISDNNGPVLPNDSVQVAIEKLEGDAKDSHQALGISRGDTDMGVYPGETISDNVSQATVNQELEAAVEDISVKKSGTIAQSTPTTVDSLLVDDFQGATWVIVARETGNPSNVKRQEINVLHNGHSGADASQVRESVTERISIGNFNLQVNSVLNGSGAGQTFGLEVDTNEASGINYTVERLNFLPLAG